MRLLFLVIVVVLVGILAWSIVIFLRCRKLKSCVRGSFSSCDKKGECVRVEWSRSSLFAPAFVEAMREVWPFARDAYLPVELGFLREYPEVVEKDEYFKPFKPLFEKGRDAVDWKQAETIMRSVLKPLFLYDASTFAPEVVAQFARDICYLVLARDAQGVARGFITFLSRPNYPKDTVKVMSCAVDPAHQGKGLGRLLMRSIFKIRPETRTIFLSTRVTNEKALKAYESWGFVEDEAPINDHDFDADYWKFLKYCSDESDCLRAEG